MRFLNLLVFAFTFCESVAQPAAFAVIRELPAYHSDVVYAGLENLIRINMPDIAPSNLQLLPAFGEIRPDSVAGQFIWKISHLDSSRAALILKNRKHNQVIDTVTFKVKMIPPPKFVFFNKRGCTFSNGGQVLLRPGMAALIENFPINIDCVVLRFTTFYYPKVGNPVEKVNVNGPLGDEVNDLVQKAKPGDKYTFRDFRYQCGCDTTIRRSPEVLNFKIK